MYIYIYINDIRLKDPSGTSDLGFQVWTAVRLGISSLNSCQTSDPRAHESKIQDPICSKNFSWIQSRNLGSKWDCWIQGFPTQVFQNLGSWIRIQDFCPGSKKSFLKILDLGSLQCQTCDFQIWTLFRLETQVTETGVKPKTKHELQTKTLSKKLWCLSYVAFSRFCCNAHPHPLRVAAEGSARYCIILNLV